ncbi:MAG: T9SS type A sorting domain-containing protein [Salibacteraceae bacterium]
MKKLYTLLVILLTASSLAMAQIPGKLEIDISPNPFQEEIQLHWEETPTQEVQVDILNLLGEKLISQRFEAGHSVNEYYLKDLNTLAPGYYFLRIASGNDLATIRVVKS